MYLGLLMEFQMVIHNICNSLSVGSRSRPAAVNVISNPGQLISHSVGYICSKKTINLKSSYKQTTLETSKVYPVLVRESAPMTTPPLNSTAMIDVYFKLNMFH